MADKADRILDCPECGARVTGSESSCPRCGKEFGKGSKFKCPFCGTLVSKRSRKCPSCKVDLKEGPGKTAAKPEEEVTAELTKGSKQPESTQLVREESRVFCPSCKLPLEGTESECPNCGQALKKEEKPTCPICGTPFDSELAECPKCGIPLERLSQKTGLTQPSEATPRDLSSVSIKPPAEMRPCPLCEAIIPTDCRKCPVCDMRLVEPESEAAVAQPEAGPVETAPSETLPESPSKIEAPVKRAVKKRKLKVAKTTATTLMSQREITGLTNGLGRTNGMKVTAAGAVKGGAFVNGTGTSDTLAAEKPGKGRSVITRWQFLAVLVAVIIVISTFVFLSYSNEPGNYSVDGHFDEWDNAAIYGTKIESSSLSSNIVEWSVGTHSSELYVYMRAQGHIMSSLDAESYYLFVDSDGSNETGYVTESIGADYMLELTGWDYLVRSSSLSQYSSPSDQYNWSAWSPTSSLSFSLVLDRLEASTTIPMGLGETSRFLLVSKDSADRGSVSYTAPLKGGVLIVREEPSEQVTLAGVVSKSASTVIMTLRFSCEGEDGQVSEVNPALVGAPLSYQIPAFSLAIGEEHTTTIALDTSSASDGDLVSAKLLESSIVSTFSSVEIIGFGASAYVGSPPSVVSIDGAFADWSGPLSTDQDSAAVDNPNLDIDAIGKLSTSSRSYFYVSVDGDICSGTYVPAIVAKPSGTGGGGTIILPRRTAEDCLNIYVDSDKSNASGQLVALDTKLIGADQLIEIKGLFGKITSTKEYDYSISGKWVEMPEEVMAAKDEKRMEIGVSTTSLEGSADIDFIVETTSWMGRSDLAALNPSSIALSTRSWTVDPATTSPYATSMSHQRKLFYDGINYWSFYYNGTDTVHKYSVDGGQTWSYSGPVFTTPGINETSIWYDSSSSTVYAVGDTTMETNAVSVQVGTVDAPAHTISWNASDSSLTASTVALGGKNTYITKDSNGYLWVLSSNCTQAQPAVYQLSAFRSVQANSTASWVFSGQMLATASGTDNVKGSIVPAGSGSDVWAVYGYGGNVAARKFDGIWQAPQPIYPQAGSKANTDNSPPSVVVDGKRVVHVVYGTGRKIGQISIPLIEYSHNESGMTTFTLGISLDPAIAPGIGDYYPTISLDSSTDDLYVFWLQSDSTHVPKTVVGKKYTSGIWSDMTIQQQTIFAKSFLTSLYSAPDAYGVGWQWTQNTTSPIEVIYDGTQIPEFDNLTLPILGVLVLFAVYGIRCRFGREPEAR